MVKKRVMGMQRDQNLRILEQKLLTSSCFSFTHIIHTQRNHRFEIVLKSDGGKKVTSYERSLWPISFLFGGGSAKRLDLSAQGVGKHVHSASADRLPQRHKVERRREAITKAKQHHGGNVSTSILQRPAAVGHAVLLRHTPRKVVLITGAINFLILRGGWVGPLLTVEDRKVIVCKEAARVAFRTKGRAKDNQVLRERCVQNGHGTHGASCVVEEPLIGDTDVVRVTLLDRLDDVVGELRSSSVIAKAGLCGRDRSLDQLLEDYLVKDDVLGIHDDVVGANEHGQDERQNAQAAL